MKKLMIAAFAVAFAAVAQAAAVTWNSGAYAAGFSGPDSATLANSQLYTMTISIYTDALGQNAVADLTGTEVAKAKPNGSYTTTTNDVLAGDKTYYIKAVVVGNDGVKDWILESEIASFTTGVQGNSNLNFATGAGFDEAGSKWGAWTAAAVPEPTSALMLLVGLAGLALKRKVA